MAYVLSIRFGTGAQHLCSSLKPPSEVGKRQHVQPHAHPNDKHNGLDQMGPLSYRYGAPMPSHIVLIASLRFKLNEILIVHFPEERRYIGQTLFSLNLVAGDEAIHKPTHRRWRLNEFPDVDPNRIKAVLTIPAQSMGILPFIQRSRQAQTLVRSYPAVQVLLQPKAEVPARPCGTNGDPRSPVQIVSPLAVDAT